MKRLRVKGAIALMALVAATFLNGSQATADDVPWSQRLTGYLAARDGTLLKYSVLLPRTKGDAGDGRYPTIVNYSGYEAGSIGSTAYQQGATAMLPQLDRALLQEGYALVGVNMRGTGCSSGELSFFSKEWGTDGADAVEWIAQQPWSNSKVGMANYSFAGISQLFTASERPKHLVAIAPGLVVTDPFRDIIPGGVPNTRFPEGWSTLIQLQWLNAASAAAEEGDLLCLANLSQNFLLYDKSSPVAEQKNHPYIDASTQARILMYRTNQINVPVLSMEAWQDEATGVRGGYYQERLDPQKTWYIGTNGVHPSYASLQFRKTLIRFFNYFLKQQSNDFENTPHVQIWQETTGAVSPEIFDNFYLQGSFDEVAFSTIAPGWVIERPQLPVEVGSVAFELDGDGRLTTSGRRFSDEPDAYEYPLTSPSVNAPGEYGAWKPRAPGSVAYTTPALIETVTFFGSGSADLWISSTAADTDLQVTITEVRPDGQEQYVQRGWLRLSTRELEPSLSTPLRPVHAFNGRAAAPLSSTDPVLARVEIQKFSHTFRAGSAIRMWIDAPSATGNWGFDSVATPATNRIWHDAVHGSRLLLGRLAHVEAPASLPACGSILSEPCRPNSVPVPKDPEGCALQPAFADAPQPAFADAPRASTGCSVSQPSTSPASASALFTVFGLLALVFVGRGTKRDWARVCPIYARQGGTGASSVPGTCPE